MPSTFNIPTTTLAVGAHSFGPASVPAADNEVILTIDRTVANGFNSQPGTTQMTVAVDQSNDGGTTWQNLASMGPVVGGSFTLPADKGGGTLASQHLTTWFNPGAGRVARATVTVSGASVAVAGTLTTA